MRTHGFAVGLLLAVGIMIGPVGATEEDAGAHAKATTRTIVLDSEVVRPSSTVLGTNESVVFENHATQPLVVTFTEPADLMQRIRCGLVRAKATDPERAPWALFSWEDGKMKGVIPPGRFASVCSLAPGHYTFLVTRQSPGARTPSGELGERGEIEVK
jgi:hypothetical protein